MTPVIWYCKFFENSFIEKLQRPLIKYQPVVLGLGLSLRCLVFSCFYLQQSDFSEDCQQSESLHSSESELRTVFFGEIAYLPILPSPLTRLTSWMLRFGAEAHSRRRVPESGRENADNSPRPVFEPGIWDFYRHGSILFNGFRMVFHRRWI